MAGSFLEDMEDKTYKRAYIGGTFDLFHPGHVNLFRAAKEIAKEVIVALNTDEFAARYKRPPIMALPERMIMVESCKYVDLVTVNEGGEDSKPAILRCRPDAILHGDDWTGDSLMKQMGLTHEFLRQHGIAMEYVPYTCGISSTDLERRSNQRAKSASQGS